MRVVRFGAIVLALLALAAPSDAQLAFGPRPPGASATAGEELAPLSYGAGGQADVMWAERLGAAAQPLPKLPNVTARLELADGRSWLANLTQAPTASIDRGRLSAAEVRWATLKFPGEPDLLGVHLITERRADGVLLAWIKVSNGALRTEAPDSYPGGVFYKRLSITVDGGRWVPEILRAGERIENGRRTWVIADGAHYFPPQAQLNRRAAIAIDSSHRFELEARITQGRSALELRGLELPARYDRFGGAKLTLPTVDRQAIAEAKAARWNALAAHLRNGTPNPSLGLQAGGMGPFMPTGGPEPGTAGGDGIEPLPGWEQSREAALLRRLEHDLAMERMPVALFDAKTGRPVARLPKAVDYRLTRGKQKLTKLPWTVRPLNPANPSDDRRTLKDWNAGDCIYRIPLAAYEAIDGQHLVRATRNGEAAWWLARDWLARLDLEMIAADARYSWTLHEQAPSGGWQPFGLRSQLAQARAKPGLGDPALGREFGWVEHAWAIDLSAAGAFTPRAEKLEHALAALELVGLVAMPTGITQRLVNGFFFGSPDPWTQNGVPTDVDVAQWVLEGPIVGNGTFGLMRNCNASAEVASRATAAITNLTRSALMNPEIAPKPSPWNPQSFGIAKWAGVARKGGAPIDPIIAAYGEADPTNCWHLCAIAWELTQDPAFLDAANGIGVPVDTREQRIATLGGTNQLSTAALLSALQRAPPP